MAGVLEVVYGDTKKTQTQIQEGGTPIDVTGYTFAAHIGTSTPSTVAGTIVTAAAGEVEFPFSGVAVGTYPAEIVITSTAGIQTSEVFTLLVRAPIA